MIALCEDSLASLSNSFVSTSRRVAAGLLLGLATPKAAVADAIDDEVAEYIKTMRPLSSHCKMFRSFWSESKMIWSLKKS